MHAWKVVHILLVHIEDSVPKEPLHLERSLSKIAFVCSCLSVLEFIFLKHIPNIEVNTPLLVQSRGPLNSWQTSVSTREVMDPIYTNVWILNIKKTLHPRH